MIVYGTRDITAEAADAPVVDLDNLESLEIDEGQILQVLGELTFSGFERRLPPALHPTHPPYASMLFYRAVDSPFGPFTMAQVRISALAGISRFSYAVRGWIDNPVAGGVLGRRWGYRLDHADVTVRRRHDRTWGTVRVGGALVLEAGLFDPEPVAGKDANYTGHLNLARIEQDGSPVPMLVQAGPQLAFQSCDRGRPTISVFDAGAIGCDPPYWPISAFAGSCAFLFTPVSFVCDPAVPAVDAGMSLMGALHAIASTDT
jgi:hypothetical protein